jgi:hypothetical protein
MRRGEEMEQPVDPLAEWDDASPTDPSLHSVHGDYHQSVSTYRERQQTQPLDFLEPQPTHRPHQKTQPMDLLGPQPTYRMHPKTQPMDLTHLQLQGMHAAYEQSVAGHPRQVRKAHSGRRPSYQVIAISSLLVVSLVAITFLFVSSKRNPSNTTVISNATLVTSGKAIPGQTLQVVGKHFPPRQTVLITLDNQPLVKNKVTAYTSHVFAMSLSMGSLLSVDISGTPIPIHADGTFTVVIHIDAHWKAGSTHYLSVYNQQGKELKSLNLPIEAAQLTGQGQQAIYMIFRPCTYLTTVIPNAIVHRPE